MNTSNSLLFVLFSAIMIFTLTSCLRHKTNQEPACQILRVLMVEHQGESFGGKDPDLSYPMLNNATYVREVFEQIDDGSSGCTIRIRMPDGEENLYTYIMSDGPISLRNSSEGSGAAEGEGEGSEGLENKFGPYENHYFFLNAGR